RPSGNPGRFGDDGHPPTHLVPVIASQPLPAWGLIFTLPSQRAPDRQPLDFARLIPMSGSPLPSQVAHPSRSPAVSRIELTTIAGCPAPQKRLLVRSCPA